MEFDPSYYIVKVGTIVQYLKVLDLSGSRHSLFRGHVDSSWDLSPSLERFYKEAGAASYLNESWQELESLLLEEFIRQSKPFMDFIPEHRIEWLVQAQHHGLPTPLLDWTTNPLKALFFAAETSRFDNSDGAVYFANGSFFTIKEVEQSMEERSKEIHCFHPKHINERIVS